MNDFQEINSDKLRQYVHSSKSVNFHPGGCKLLAKVGHVKFDFSSFPDAISCDIYVCRISGNGETIINCLQEENVVIVSKTPIIYNIDIDKDKIVEISRPAHSIGEINISKIVISAEKETQMSKNWKQLINKCGKYSCLRLVGGRLFASPGAFIEHADLIEYVETNPPYLYKKEGSKIVFNNSCEITELGLSKFSAPPDKQTPYVARAAPTEIYVAKTEVTPPNESVATNSELLYKPLIEKNMLDINQNILYDSTKIDFEKIAPPQNKAVKAIRSMGKKYLLMRPSGVCNIPIATLEPNTEYICVIHAKLLNGNGRIKLGFSEELHIADTKEIIFTNHATNKYVYLMTSSVQPGKSIKLHLMRPPDSCTGEVLISRILIINSLDIDRARRALEGSSSQVYTREEIPRSEIYSNVVLPSVSSDQILNLSKKYARYVLGDSASYQEDLSEGLITTNISGVNWFHKMKTFFPNLNLGSGRVSISSVGAICPAEIIWIDAFTNISEEDLNKLKQARIILSPSPINMQFMQEKLPDSDIRLFKRPLPFKSPKEIPFFNNLNFILSFERCKENVDFLLNLWQDDWPRLALVGARGYLPDYVIPINEYMPYENLLYVLHSSKCIIDLPEIDNYQSSFLSLAIAMGIPVISTNKYIEGKTNCTLISKNKEELMVGVQNTINITNKDAINLFEYSKIEMSNLRYMFLI